MAPSRGHQPLGHPATPPSSGTALQASHAADSLPPWLWDLESYCARCSSMPRHSPCVPSVTFQFTYHRVLPLKVHNSVVFSAFTVLGNGHHYRIPELSPHRKGAGTPTPPPAPAAADLLSVPPGLAGLTVLHVVLGGSVPHPRGVSALPASRWLKCVPSGGRPRFIHLGWWVSGSASLFSKGVFESILGCSPPCLASGVLPWGPHDILSQNVVQECSPSLSLGQLRSQT